MRRGLVILSIGCGRVGFEPGDALVAQLADAPALPSSLVCDAQRVALPPVAAGTDVAIATTGSTIHMLWAEPGGEVFATTIDASGIAGQVLPLATGPVTAIGGLFLRDTDSLFVTANGPAQTLWRRDPALSMIATETSVMSRAPLITDDTRVPTVWIRGEPAGLRVTYVTTGGVLGAELLTTTTDPVIGIAAADNDNHGHVSWIEDRVGGPLCTQSDLDFLSAPVVSNTSNSGVGCDELRIDSGPGARDSIMNLMRDPSGAITFRYRGGFDDFERTLWPAGRAPRVVFDGTRFWAAWIGQVGGSDSLVVASIEQDGTFETAELPGWTPISDEALELVRTGTTIFVAFHDGDELVTMRMCP